MVESDTSMTVYAGVNDRSQLNAGSVQKRSSVLLRMYENNYYSIALIKVGTSFTMNNGVAMASITTYGFRAVEDNICNSGSYGVQLSNATRMKYLEFELGACKCNDWLTKHHPKELENDWICRQNEEVSVKICLGDFGLGMMCDGNLQAICIGIVFYEDKNSCNEIEGNLEKCEKNNSIGLFVDVCYYIDWIGSFVSSIEKARAACDAVSVATLNTPTPKWSTCNLFVAFTYLCQINIFQR